MVLKVFASGGLVRALDWMIYTVTLHEKYTARPSPNIIEHPIPCKGTVWEIGVLWNTLWEC